MNGFAAAKADSDDEGLKDGEIAHRIRCCGSASPFFRSTRGFLSQNLNAAAHRKREGDDEPIAHHYGAFPPAMATQLDGSLEASSLFSNCKRFRSPAKLLLGLSAVRSWTWIYKQEYRMPTSQTRTVADSSSTRESAFAWALFGWGRGVCVQMWNWT